MLVAVKEDVLLFFIDLSIWRLARAFPKICECTPHVAVEIRMLEKACSDNIVLSCMNDVTPCKIEPAIQSLSARRGVVKQFHDVDVVKIQPILQSSCGHDKSRRRASAAHLAPSHATEDMLCT